MPFKDPVPVQVLSPVNPFTLHENGGGKKNLQNEFQCNVQHITSREENGPTAFSRSSKIEQSIEKKSMVFMH